MPRAVRDSRHERDNSLPASWHDAPIIALDASVYQTCVGRFIDRGASDHARSIVALAWVRNGKDQVSKFVVVAAV